jgi:hypothetical protein
MRRPVLIPLLAALVAVSGCSTVSREARVRQKLVDAGVKPELADCMAGKLVRKLNSSELRDLAHAAKLPGRDVGSMSFDELTARLRALDDPHVVSVVTRVGIGCAIAG